MVVVEAKQSHENWNIFGDISLCDGYLVHRRHSIEELTHVIEAVEEGKRQDADGRADRVAAADPIPESEHILVRDAELLRGGEVSGDSAQMLGKDLGLWLIGEGSQDMLAAGARVKHGLGGRECLADDHKQS